jgi:TRAP-type C4-dicarboxylate transport system permease large subunit
MITPPVGINLYVVHGLRRHGRIDDVIAGVGAVFLAIR